MLKVVDNYCSCILFVIQVLYFSRCALNKKITFTRKKLILIIMLTSFFYSVASIYFNGIIKTLFLALVSIILYKFLYKISYAKSTFMYIIYIIILLFPDLMVLFCLTNLFNISKKFYYSVIAGSFLGSFIVFVFYIIIVFLLRKALNKLLDTQIDTDKKIVLFSFFTFLCISLLFYTLIDKFLFTNDILLYLLCIIILLLSLSNLIKQVIENKRLSAKYDKLLEFMTTYEEEIENQRILRHEIKNEFLVVRAKLLDSQDNNEIISYIDEILKDKITVKQEHYAKFGYLPPNGIKGLCYLKTQQAENLGIQVSINISKRVRDFDIKTLKLSEQRNLARILGVFLDNAREASNLSKDKKMGLEVYFDKKEGLKFIVSNTFDNVVDISKIGKEKFSTKGKNRGHGLMLVNYILETNKVFNLKTEITKNVYTQNLTIKIKNK